MTTVVFHHVFVKGRSCVGGRVEKEGPIGHLLDATYEDAMIQQKSYEKAERKMLEDACKIALKKAQIEVKDIDVAVGGDLLNQLTSSHYFMKALHIPFIGMYAACATSSLVIGQAGIWIEHKYAKKAMAFTSSHTETAERQFRYPNEYGIQKKETTTSTVTGAGCIVLSDEPSTIALHSFTLGEVVDWRFTDTNDMGKAMAPAAMHTLLKHFKNTNTTFEDYDVIATGDLSKLGFSFLIDLLYQEGYNVKNRMHDCGLMVYDIQKQKVFCGGSGCACSMIVSMGKLLKMLEEKQAKRILVLATGALLSPVATAQKESIPCIAHAIAYERREV